MRPNKTKIIIIIISISIFFILFNHFRGNQLQTQAPSTIEKKSITVYENEFHQDDALIIAYEYHQTNFNVNHTDNCEVITGEEIWEIVCGNELKSSTVRINPKTRKVVEFIGAN